MRGLFPDLPPGARGGQTWFHADTTVDTMPVATVTTVRQMTYTARGTEIRAGVPILRVEASTRLSLTGSVPPGSTGGFTGNGSGTATYFVGPEERFLGGNETVTSTLAISVGMPDPVPVTVKTTRTVSVLQ